MALSLAYVGIFVDGGRCILLADLRAVSLRRCRSTETVTMNVAFSELTVIRFIVTASAARTSKAVTTYKTATSIADSHLVLFKIDAPR